ncbi:MAG: InlB B-repeat-containing protein [Spirochaetaceae bacterium]|jgi:hypothetical protein|nr:InlB B-repeat-containing protein [Spirochaetaceae bacterium]
MKQNYFSKQSGLFTTAAGFIAAAALAICVLLAACGDVSTTLDNTPGKGNAGSEPKDGGITKGGYTFFIDPQGGYWTTDMPEDYLDGALDKDSGLVVKLPTAYIQRPGMIFVGWYSKPTPQNITSAEPVVPKKPETPEEPETPPEAPYISADGLIPLDDIFTEGMRITKNTTLYAWWQELAPDYRIVNFIPFYTEDALGINRQALPDEEGGYKIPPDNFPPLIGGPEHYHVAGAEGKPVWWTERAGGEIFSADTVITDNKTVYGHWAGNEYTVTFNFNGGENKAGKTSVPKTIVYSIDSDNTVTLGKDEKPNAPTGYKGLLGWFRDQRTNISSSSGSGKVPAANDPKRFTPGVTEVSGSFTVYALWMEAPDNAYIITFEPYDGADSTFLFAPEGSDGTHKINGTIPPTGERPYYEPVSANQWYYRYDGGEERKLSADSEIPGDITAYAKWDGKEYVVTFDWDYADKSPQTRAVKYPDDTLNKAGQDMPAVEERTGYTTDGKWYISGGSGGEFTADTPVTGALTVKPGWRAKTYNITFYKEAGGASYATGQVTYPGESVNNMPASPKYDGSEIKIFGGWRTAPNGGGDAFTNSNITGSQDVYASWLPLPAGWTYNTSTGSMTKNYTFVAAPQEFTVPDGFTSGKYEFELWGADGGGNGNYPDQSDPYMGGKGGYLKASITGSSITPTLYVYTGESGKEGSKNNDYTLTGAAATFGGGGAGGDRKSGGKNATVMRGGGSGGGATFISTMSNPNGIRDRPTHDAGVLFAGGGGGGTVYSALSKLVAGYGSGGDTAGIGYRWHGGRVDGGSDGGIVFDTIWGGSNIPPVRGNEDGIGSSGRSGTDKGDGDYGAGGGGGGYRGGMAQTMQGAYSNSSGGGGNGFVDAGYTALSRLDGNASNIPANPAGNNVEANHSRDGYVRVTYAP